MQPAGRRCRQPSCGVADNPAHLVGGQARPRPAARSAWRRQASAPPPRRRARFPGPRRGPGSAGTPPRLPRGGQHPAQHRLARRYAESTAGPPRGPELCLRRSSAPTVGAGTAAHARHTARRGATPDRHPARITSTRRALARRLDVHPTGAPPESWRRRAGTLAYGATSGLIRTLGQAAALVVTAACRPGPPTGFLPPG